MIETKQRESWRDTGLTEEEVELSRQRDGKNSLPQGKRTSFLKQFFVNLTDPIIRVLLIALAINVIVLFREVNWFETGGILLAVFLSTFVSTLSEWGSEKAFEKLRAQGSTTLCRVRREGRVVQISREDLVVGDLLLVAPGEQLQADGIVVDGTIWVDQSALNGESQEVEKRTCATSKEWDLGNCGQVFCGSLVCTGNATIRVARVGENTLYGTLAKELQTRTRESPLKLRLSKLASQISKLGYVMAAIVAVAYLFGVFFINLDFDMQALAGVLQDKKFLFETIMHTITLVITVIVVAVPEGLPMMITVVLSSNMRRMLKSQVLVRKMVGIETAGSLNILFTDKTGTLTTGKMSVLGVLCGSGVMYQKKRALDRAPLIKQLLTESAICNTDSTWSDGQAVGGNATDRALLSHFYTPTLDTIPVLAKLPFDSARKMAAVRTQNRIFVKGAPDVLMGRVGAYFAPDGRVIPFTEEEKRSFANLLHQHGAGGERLIMICVADGWATSLAQMNLTLVGVVLLRDRVRSETYEVVNTLAGAGVQVVMVTGDGEDTARAIAQEAGLIGEDVGKAMLSGADMALLTDQEVKERMPYLRVVWRALPSDKSRLVRLAGEMGLVTGMTGDGINDAPALKLADVGFAMGSGTDIAKEAGDIVILDDRLASICQTVLFGRTIFKSIRKFITFQLSMNLCAVGVSLIGQFVGMESPVTIIQMLWVNMIMDTLGGLAFAGEAPMPFYMKEKPKKREEPILSPAMIHQILITGFYTLGLGIWFLLSPFWGAKFGKMENELYFLTLFFALFIFSGITNSFCARSERMRLFHGIGKNPGFLIIMALVVGVQLVMIYFGGALFRTTPVSAGDLLMVISLCLTIIPFDFLRRLFYRLTKG